MATLNQNDFVHSVLKAASLVPVILEGEGSPRYNSRKDESGATIYEIGLPGLTKNDVSVTVENGIMTVSSEYESPNKGKYTVSSALVSPFRMRFVVGQTSRVSSAKMENGMLTIRLDTKRDVTQVAID